MNEENWKKINKDEKVLYLLNRNYLSSMTNAGLLIFLSALILACSGLKLFFDYEIYRYYNPTIYIYLFSSLILEIMGYILLFKLLRYNNKLDEKYKK